VPDRELGQALLTIARDAIGAELGLARRDGARHPALGAPAATFVTLRQDAELRGCIGSLEARRALGADVRANAVAAAFRDPRFPPLAVDEFRRISVEVSLLSAHEPIVFDDEEHLFRQLRPGIDGVVLQYGRHRATFLPQVWESLPEPRAFVAALKHKAGLAASLRTTAFSVARYTVDKWAEGEQEPEVLRA
jgi:AmmeMemoRadiSam system protein A